MLHDKIASSISLCSSFWGRGVAMTHHAKPRASAGGSVGGGWGGGWGVSCGLGLVVTWVVGGWGGSRVGGWEGVLVGARSGSCRGPNQHRAPNTVTITITNIFITIITYMP